MKNKILPEILASGKPRDLSKHAGFQEPTPTQTPAPTAHTPLPWSISPIYSDILGGRGTVAVVNSSATKSESERLANSALIVTAVNSHARLTEQNAALVRALSSALRYIEVKTAYQGAMTADEVEAAIKAEYFPAIVAIGANSCNTLARFDFNEARAALSLAKSQS